MWKTWLSGSFNCIHRNECSVIFSFFKFKNMATKKKTAKKKAAPKKKAAKKAKKR